MSENGQESLLPLDESARNQAAPDPGSPEPDDAEDAEETAQTSTESRPSRRRRPNVQRAFPSVPFEEALELPLAIQLHASGQRVRRMRLFELLSRSPDSSTSRSLVTNSARYGLTTGSYAAEWLDLTPDGRAATSDAVPEREKIRARYRLAVEQFAPFKRLHDQFVNNRLPARPIMVDFVREEGVSEEESPECVDIFLLNAKFVGILQSISGAERLVTLDYVLDYAPAGRQTSSAPVAAAPTTSTVAASDGRAAASADGSHWDRICFYVTPIGADGSEERLHADLFLGSIIEPALEEFGLEVVRADKIEEAGLISRQIIEHIVRSKLVIADLSFHNPNVFYELALRHASGLPTVQLIRAAERLPFDVNQVRTIQIDTSSIYTLVPQLDVYRSAIAAQVRRALEAPESVDSPVSSYLPQLRLAGR